MAIMIVRMDPMNTIALRQPADRISSGAMTANVFRVICSAVALLNAMTHRMKHPAMVIHLSLIFWRLFPIKISCLKLGTISVGCNAVIEFDCGDGMCISLDKVCDGVNDCGQWEDEPKGKCNVNECAINNGGCLHTCVDTAWGFRCECHHGYTLTHNSTCIGKQCFHPIFDNIETSTKK